MNSRPVLTRRLTLLIAATAASLTLAVGATIVVGLGHLAPAADAQAPASGPVAAPRSPDGSIPPVIAAQPAPAPDSGLLGPRVFRDRDDQRGEARRDSTANVGEKASRTSGAVDSLRLRLAREAHDDD